MKKLIAILATMVIVLSGCKSTDSSDKDSKDDGYKPWWAVNAK